MRTLTFLCFCITGSTAWGCGNSAATTSTGSGGTSASTGNAASTSSTGSGSTGVTTSSGATTGSGGAGGNAAPPGPNPPAGYTMCGSGSFTQADSHTACMTIGVGPKDCDVVTISGGNWEAWCEPAKMQLYVWAEIDGAAQPAQGTCIPEFDGGARDVSPGGVGGAGSPHQVTFPMVSPNVSYEYTVAFGAPAPTGSGIFGVTAKLALLKGGGICTYADPSAPVVAGFDVAWQ